MTLGESAHATLKRSTSDAHRSLEAVMSLGPGASRADYVAYLQTLQAFHALLEPRLLGDAALVALIEDLPSRLRAEAAQADLAKLAEPERTESPPFLPPLETAAHRLGVLYVMEGSTLGGQVIARSLEQRLQLGPEVTRYVRGAGEGTAARWRSFLAALERGLTTEVGVAQAVEAARASFRLLEQWHRPPAPSGLGLTTVVSSERAS